MNWCCGRLRTCFPRLPEATAVPRTLLVRLGAADAARGGLGTIELPSFRRRLPRLLSAAREALPRQLANSPARHGRESIGHILDASREPTKQKTIECPATKEQSTAAGDGTDRHRRHNPRCFRRRPIRGIPASTARTPATARRQPHSTTADSTVAALQARAATSGGSAHGSPAARRRCLR